jgi:uncharacterized low-complexity protein
MSLLLGLLRQTSNKKCWSLNYKQRKIIMNSIKQTSVAVALGAVVLTAGFSGAVEANPFGFEQLTAGYQIDGGEGKCGEGKCGADKMAEKAKEGKCGEGKCGADKMADKAKEGKCGEGKCGADKMADKAKEGSCGGDKMADKAKEGSCGGDMKKEEKK